MAEELKYTSGYDGATTDDLLGYAQEAKELDSNANVREAKEVGVNAYVKESKELKSNEYVRSMKEQLAAEDAETVQVYDVDGVPHKISKKELISKAGIQLPSLEEIGGFVAYDTNGQALGLMSKEQVAEVVGGLIGTVTSSKNGLVDRDNDMYCRDDIPQDLNDLFAGFGRADNKTNAPASYGIVISFYTRTKGNYTCAQLYFSNVGTIYGRTRWEGWSSWKQLT